MKTKGQEMKEFDIDSLLEKAEELKALFVLGHKVIPFLEDIFLFFNEIKPLLDDVNNSIEENIKKMPNVSKQLSKVTEATENATTEIMDIVDGIQFKANMLDENLDKVKTSYYKNTNNPLNIANIIQKMTEIDVENPDEVTTLIKELKELKKNEPDECESIIDDSKELINTIREDANNIMMSLQVQDITSQQLAAVNHLLTKIQTKLKDILQKFSKHEISEVSNDTRTYNERTDITSLHKEIAFDPDAIDSIANRETRQDDIDKFIEEATKENTISNNNDDDDIDISDEGPVSQDDIDALFDNQ